MHKWCHLTNMKGQGYIKPGEEARALLMATHLGLDGNSQNL